MATQTIYLAGGCFWGVEELFRQVPGVLQTCVGYANGSGAEDATYKRVCAGGTGFRETVRVTFDADATDVDRLLWAYFQVVDPTLVNRQGNDRGEQYQAGIYWAAQDEALGARIQSYARQEQARVEASGRHFAVEVHELANFFDAEQYHQRYLVKNPGGYCHVSRAEMAAVLHELRG